MEGVHVRASCSTCSWVRAAHHAPKHAPKHVVPCAVNQLTSYAIMLSKLPCLQSLHTTRCLHPASTPCSNAISSYAITLSNLVCNAFRFLSARAAGVSSFLPTHEPALSPTHPPPRSPPAHAATRFPILPRLREIGLPRKRGGPLPGEQRTSLSACAGLGHRSATR